MFNKNFLIFLVCIFLCPSLIFAGDGFHAMLGTGNDMWNFGLSENYDDQLSYSLNSHIAYDGFSFRTNAEGYTNRGYRRSSESDTDKPEDETMNKALKEQFSKILSGFSERERQIIIMRYGLLDNKPLSLKQVGDIFGLTKERIRQLEKKTLQSLAENSEVQDMKYYIA